MGFPSSSVGKKFTCNAEDPGLIPGSGWYPGERTATHYSIIGLPWWLRWWGICLQCRRPGFNPWVGKIPWKRAWQPLQYFFLKNHHGQRSLVGSSPGSRKDSDMTEQISTWEKIVSKRKLCCSPWGVKELDTIDWTTIYVVYIYVCVCVCVCIYTHTWLNHFAVHLKHNVVN